MSELQNNSEIKKVNKGDSVLEFRNYVTGRY